ncbi:MAG TPA: hypothetical protein VLA79_09380 [Polyangia bacterium]|nr:hypothetical protein [Polyangia bacterium]
MTAREPKTPAWLVERLAQGELGGEESAAVRARLEAEGRSPDEVIAALVLADRETLAAHPPAAVAAEIRRRSAPPARRRPVAVKATFAGATLATAGALAVVLAARQLPPAPSASTLPASEPTTIKGTVPTGGARLYVYRHASAGDERLADGERAAPGDLLQLAYATTAEGFGVLLSIDGAGTVTQHWPEPGRARAVPLRVGGEVRLPSAYELDSAPAFERFFLVRADEAFDVAPILEAARALATRAPVARRAPLPLPARFNQVSLALEKTR